MAANSISRFKEEFIQVARESFFLKPVFFGSLIIRHCNGMGPCPFSDATIFCEKDENTYPVYLWWWENFFQYVAKELPKIDSPEALKQKGRTQIKKFFDAITSMSGKHEECLTKLLDDDNLTEEKIKCVLALHYFKPLSNDADYCVDKSLGCEECPACHAVINTNQTESSFGHNAVWHGFSDILVKRSIVKIDKDELAIGKLFALSIDDQEEYEMLDSSFCSNIVEVKTERKMKSYYQAIAQTIVNAFVENRKDNSCFNKFIPSFLATEKTIRILMYNCKYDKLLVSDEFEIWKDKTLNMETLMLIWVAINRFVDDSCEKTKYLIQNTAETKFRNAVGEAYHYYLNEVSRPETKVDKDKIVYTRTFNQPFNKSVKDAAFILNTVAEGIQMLKQD